MPITADVYQRVTDQIIVQLEQGVRPWLKPWHADHPAGRGTLPLRHNGLPYRGINIIVLWMAALAKGYAATRWMTFRQALELGGHIRKGEKGSLSVYAGSIHKHETNPDNGEDANSEFRYLKGYIVFNAEQIDGLPTEFYAPPDQAGAGVPRLAQADTFFSATGATIVHGGSRACYVPRTDRIHMPPIDCFDDAESYYATLGHECVHWTMHETRLARSFDRKRWGDAGYAMEELVAELGAAFLGAQLDLEPTPREDHASYLAYWLTVLRSDRRAIFSAAGHAQRAVDYLNQSTNAASDAGAPPA